VFYRKSVLNLPYVVTMSYICLTTFCKFGPSTLVSITSLLRTFQSKKQTGRYTTLSALSRALSWPAALIHSAACSVLQCSVATSYKDADDASPWWRRLYDVTANCSPNWHIPIL